MGSEMCIRDRLTTRSFIFRPPFLELCGRPSGCSGGLYSRNSYSASHGERALGASRALAEERAAPASMDVRFPNLGEACTAFYNEPCPKVTIGVVSVTELRAPEGIGPDV